MQKRITTSQKGPGALSLKLLPARRLAMMLRLKLWQRIVEAVERERGQ